MQLVKNKTVVAFAAVALALANVATSIPATIAQTVDPDLQVDSIVLAPSSPEVGESVTVTVNAQNSGSASLTSATGTIANVYDFEDFDFATTTDPLPNPYPSESDPLEPGDTFTYTFAGSFTSTGTKLLSFTIDDGDELVESDETNNVVTTTVEVVAPDDTPPIISIPAVVEITKNSARIIWTSDEASTSEVDYGLTDTYGSQKVDTTLTTSHSVLLSGLTASTTYHYMVTSVDADSNATSSADYTFTTKSSSSSDDDDDEDEDEDEDDDDDYYERVIVCHKVPSWKGYIEVPTSRFGWLNGHSKHEGDFIKTGNSCYDDDSSDGDDDDDSDDSSDDSSDDDSDNTNPVIKRLRERIQRLQYRISQFEERIIERERRLTERINRALTERVRGRILLQVEDNGEAWYVDDDSDRRYYLQNGDSAYQALRIFGLGITNEDLEKIPVGVNDRFVREDSDDDGLPDKLEESIGTDPQDADSDDDGVDDRDEIEAGTNPLGEGVLNLDNNLTNRLRGKILLQVQNRGQAWYINPADGKRYYLKDGETAYNIMRFLSLGISNDDLRQIEVGSLAP